MISSFFAFFEHINNNSIHFANKKINRVIKNYNIFNISTQHQSQNQQINKIIEESNIIIINFYEFSKDKLDDQYFILGLEKALLIIKPESLNLLHQFFNSKIKPPICFLPNTKEKFNNRIKIEYNEINFNDKFGIEIGSFIENCIFWNRSELLGNVWTAISPCILGYLVKKSYTKLNKNRINELIFPSKSFSKEIMGENDYFKLRTLGIGSIFNVELIYHIDKGELFALKKPNILDRENRKLIKRELFNYSHLKHPFIPNFYGKSSNANNLIIEFINGQELSDISKIHLSYNEKITIIFKLMLIIEFLHRNNFIYRDLKPNNIIIDQNKTPVLIDFDRMIKYNNEFDPAFTNDFSSAYVAPEVNSGNFSFESDIYSLGQVIYFIMNEKNPKGDQTVNINDFEENSDIQTIYEICVNENEEDRPLISDLILEFFVYFSSNIQIEHLFKTYESYFQNIYDKDSIEFMKNIDIDKNDPKMQYYLALVYKEGQYAPRNIKKAVYYLELAAKNNYPEAQYNCGIIYSIGKLVQKDINKAMYYFQLSAKQNYPYALYELGTIYENGEYVKRNINTAMNYYVLASKQNNCRAQYKLGLIYEKGIYLQRDINKAIYYYTLAANQNCIHGQYNLGIIYTEGKFVQKDIDKGIHYFTLAAEQNDIDAQCRLGKIYEKGELVERDINKAINYYTLAANKNSAYASYNLGLIYKKGKFIQRDINKAIYYFTLSAQKNDSYSQYELGKIYEKGKFIQRDINKAIYYYTLAVKKNNVDALNKLGEIYKKGKFVKRDISKAIYYFTLSAQQDSLISQFELGKIYEKGKFINRNINKAIYYYTLAAKKNDLEAQYRLDLIFEEGHYTPRDIDKAMHYLTLSAENNYLEALFRLGIIYEKGKNVPRDFKKAFNYYTLAANQNDSNAQFRLGFLYEKGHGVPIDMKKSIFYYQLAANQNHAGAQFKLGVFYEKGKFLPYDINKAIYYYKLAGYKNISEALFNLALIYFNGTNINYAMYYFTLSANNNNKRANYMLGVLYHEGRCIKRNIKKAIYYYKEVSSFNDQYAKNNLGVIYKNGVDNEIPKNIGFAIEYFKEAIQQSNDVSSMYNLANIYLYEKPFENSINESIELLIKIFNQNFLRQKLINVSNELLCIALIKKHGPNLEAIIDEIVKFNFNSEDLADTIIEMILDQNMNDLSFFEDLYQSYRNIDLLYDYKKKIIKLSNLFYMNHQDVNLNTNLKNITSEFYEGFGLDL